MAIAQYAELHTTIERENTNPVINTTLFPNTPSNWFWSSSPVAYNTSGLWIASFFYGHDSNGLKNDYGAVRLVRGGQAFGSSPLTTSTNDFTNNQDGTVTHKRTGLIWQRCAVGQTWSNLSCSGSANYYTYNQATALTSTFANHKDWRVPDQNELLSIVEYGTYNPAINTTLFPNTFSNDWFWSSSHSADSTYGAWVVSFSYGNGFKSYEGNSYLVLLVRGGQSSTSIPFSIAQSPLSGSPGKVFVQWGNGFSPNSTATLHVKKPDGTEYPTQQQAVDAKGHFAINYTIPADKPAGSYSWWAVDGATGKKSAVITYTITPLTKVANLYGKLHSNAANGAVLVGATVSIGSKTTTTIGDGSFSLSNIAAGQQEVHFAKTGYQPFSTTIIIVPSTGSKDMGNRWLVQNGMVKPTIAQAPLVGLPGTTFTQWGTGFTPNGMATLHFKKSDGTEYPTATVPLDNLGHLETPYRTPMDKPAGVYTWWAVDSATNKASNIVVYTVTEAVNPCQAPTELDALLKITTANCRDKWNLVVFYKERYNGYIEMNQRLLQGAIKGTLTQNAITGILIDVVSSLSSIVQIPSLKGEKIVTLTGIGGNQTLQSMTKVLGNKHAEIWFGLIGAGLESLAAETPWPILEQAGFTLVGIGNDLYATVGVTTLTKRFQELEIAKQFLFRYYSYGSQMDLVAKSYGLTANARMVDIINAIGNQIGAKNPWYWFNDYDVLNVLDHIKTNMEIVGMKEVAYSK